MTTATLPRLALAPGFPLKLFTLKLLRSIGTVFDGVTEGRGIAARYDRLSRMSDTELAQRGLIRQDISRAAVNGIAGW